MKKDHRKMVFFLLKYDRFVWLFLLRKYKLILVTFNGQGYKVPRLQGYKVPRLQGTKVTRYHI